MNYQKEIKTNELRNFRRNLGLRQEDVAAKLKMDITDRLSHWETGRALPNLVNVFRLSALYKKYPHELYPELFQIIAKEVQD